MSQNPETVYLGCEATLTAVDYPKIDPVVVRIGHDTDPTKHHQKTAQKVVFRRHLGEQVVLPNEDFLREITEIKRI